MVLGGPLRTGALLFFHRLRLHPCFCTFTISLGWSMDVEIIHLHVLYCIKLPQTRGRGWKLGVLAAFALRDSSDGAERVESQVPCRGLFPCPSKAAEQLPAWTLQKWFPVQLLKYKIVYIKPMARKFLFFEHPSIPWRWTKKAFHLATMFQNGRYDVPVIQYCIWCLWASAVCSLICSHSALHVIKLSISVG